MNSTGPEKKRLDVFEELRGDQYIWSITGKQKKNYEGGVKAQKGLLRQQGIWFSSKWNEKPLKSFKQQKDSM